MERNSFFNVVLTVIFCFCLVSCGGAGSNGGSEVYPEYPQESEILEAPVYEWKNPPPFKKLEVDSGKGTATLVISMPSLLAKAFSGDEANAALKADVKHYRIDFYLDPNYATYIGSWEIDACDFDTFSSEVNQGTYWIHAMTEGDDTGYCFHDEEVVNVEAGKIAHVEFNFRPTNHVILTCFITNPNGEYTEGGEYAVSLQGDSNCCSIFETAKYVNGILRFKVEYTYTSLMAAHPCNFNLTVPADDETRTFEVQFDILNIVDGIPMKLELINNAVVLSVSASYDHEQRSLSIDTPADGNSVSFPLVISGPVTGGISEVVVNLTSGNLFCEEVVDVVNDDYSLFIDVNSLYGLQEGNKIEILVYDNDGTVYDPDFYKISVVYQPIPEVAQDLPLVIGRFTLDGKTLRIADFPSLFYFDGNQAIKQGVPVGVAYANNGWLGEGEIPPEYKVSLDYSGTATIDFSQFEREIIYFGFRVYNTDHWAQSALMDPNEVEGFIRLCGGAYSLAIDNREDKIYPPE